MSVHTNVTAIGMSLGLLALSGAGHAAAVANCQVYDGLNTTVVGTTSCSATTSHPFSDTVTHTVYLDPALTVPQQDLFTFDETAQAFINGSLGTYHAKASVSGDLNTNYYHYTVVNSMGVVTAEVTDLNPLGDNPSGVAQVNWTDPLMFVAPGLTSVQVRIGVPLSASIISNCITGNGLALATIDLNSGPAQNSLGATASSVSACVPEQNYSGTALVTVPVGQQVNLHGFFKVSTAITNWTVDPGYSNYTDPAVGHALASVDASNTAHFLLDVVTAGAHYYRVDDPTALDAYAAVVPAPATVWLLGTGCLGLMGRLRRRSTG